MGSLPHSAGSPRAFPDGGLGLQGLGLRAGGVLFGRS